MTSTFSTGFPFVAVTHPFHHKSGESFSAGPRPGGRDRLARAGIIVVGGAPVFSVYR